MSDKKGVFISYARSDGEAFATALRERLEREAPDIHVWQDRVQMMGGVSWWRQITDAIESAAYVVLVMTPAAIQSEVVKKEWRYAQQVGTCVFPIMAGSVIDFENAPKWMRDSHFYDLDKEWHSFLTHLREPCMAISVAFMAPDMPDHFTGRKAELEQLQHHLIAGENPSYSRVVLRGTGGFGKTALAAALCHSEAILQAYDDGIFWITLGEEPDVLAALSKLYAALTGERPNFVDIEDAAVELAERWGENDCLLVIDDVWDDAHLHPFMRGGSHVSRLITTRDNAIANEMEHAVTVGEMKLEDAARLLAGRVTTDDPADWKPFHDLAKRLGQWALLLELAGATLKQRMDKGDSLEGALAYLNKALDKRGVVAFDRRNASDRHQAVERTIEVSLDQLDDAERASYIELAVFMNDVDIPLSSVAALWELDEFDTEDRLQRLDELSLLNVDLQTATIHVGRLMNDYLESKIENLPALHNRLIANWGDPLKLPDAYAWGMVIYHLIQAGRMPDARALLSNFAFLQAKLDATDAVALVSDYEHLHDDVDLLVIHNALLLSLHVLGEDKTQLAAQLVGRLLDQEAPVLQSLVQQAQNWQAAPWFRPLTNTLTAPGGPLLRTLTGHNSVINCVWLLQFGRRAASAGEDGTIKIWDLVDQTEVATLRGHSRGVNALAVTQDERRLISGGDDNMIKVWDLQSGTETTTLLDHILPVTAVAISPDGNTVLSGSLDNSLKIWSLHDPTNPRSVRGHRQVVTAIAFTPDGTQFISGCGDHKVRLWDLAAGKLIRVLEGHTAAVRAVAVSPDGRRAISGSADRTLRVWNLETGECLATMIGHKKWINTVAISPDGQRAVSGSDDRTLRLWNMTSFAKVRTLRGHTGVINALMISQDSHWVLSGSSDTTLRQWDISVPSNSITNSAVVLPATVRRVAITSQNLGITVHDDRHVNLIDIHNGDAPVVKLRGHAGPVRAVAVTPDGQWAVTGGADTMLKVWNLAQPSEARTLAGHHNWVLDIAMLPHGDQIISASADRTLKLWDFASGTPLKTLTGHTDWVMCVAPHPTLPVAISGGRDKAIYVWDLDRGVHTQIMNGHKDWLTALTLTADGNRLISGAEDHLIMIWDWQQGTLLQTLSGHRGRIRDLILMPGDRILSASDDNTLRLWDIHSGKVLVTYTADVPLLSCAVAPDGVTILVGDELGKAHRLRLIQNS